MQAQPIKQLMSGRLFKVILRVTRLSHDESRKLASDLVRYFQDADVNWEFWSGGTVGVVNMEFTTQFAMKPGEGEKSSEDLARICANVAWRSLGDYREPIKVKVAPFADFNANTTIYVMDDAIYWCDFYDEELDGALTVEGTPANGKATR